MIETQSPSDVCTFTLKPQQHAFIGAEEQFVAYVSAVGTGKTTALILKALFHSQESPGNFGVIVRKNYTDLRTSTIRDFEDYTRINVNENTHEAKLPNGSTLLFLHGDVLSSLKNINAGFIAIEQADDFADSVAWDMLIQRLRRQVKFRVGFLVANARGHNWVWDRFVREQKPNHLCVQARTHDFADILPPDYITNLEANLPEAMYRRFVLNSHDEMEGLVYSEFRESEHVIEPHTIPDGWEKGFVLDHGFRNPTAVLWYAIDYDGNVVLYDEHYQTEKPVSFHAEQIKRRLLDTGYADPSIFSITQSRGAFMYSIADEYRECGINLIPSAREEEKAAIARVNEFFKAGRVKVFRTLTNALHEFSSWKWKPTRFTVNPQSMPEEPEDYQNHLCDCLKYLVQTRFGRSVEPEPKPEPHSLEHYERHVEMLNHRREAARSIW